VLYFDGRFLISAHYKDAKPESRLFKHKILSSPIFELFNVAMDITHKARYLTKKRLILHVIGKRTLFSKGRFNGRGKL
jgi:hypothetical protein